jgi:hypothetical protein
MCVNENTYFAHTKEEANRMAIDHLEASKQQYANENGQCLPDDTPDWVDDGNQKCASGINDPDGSGTLRFYRQTDRNPNSATYRQTRWYRNGNCVLPPDPNNPDPGDGIPDTTTLPPPGFNGWADTGYVRCLSNGTKQKEQVLVVDGVPTGQKQMVDIGTCACVYNWTCGEMALTLTHVSGAVPFLSTVPPYTPPPSCYFQRSIALTDYMEVNEPSIFDMEFNSWPDRFKPMQLNGITASVVSSVIQLTDTKFRVTVIPKNQYIQYIGTDSAAIHLHWHDSTDTAPTHPDGIPCYGLGINISGDMIAG